MYLLKVLMLESFEANIISRAELDCLETIIGAQGFGRAVKSDVLT